jgi:Family of unknown function (DUF6011)
MENKNMDTQIFRCREAKLHTLPDQPTLRVAELKQLVAHHKNLETLNADEVLRRFGPSPDADDPDFDFFGNACHGMLEYENYWKQCNLVFAWIDEKPIWVSAGDWQVWILENPEKPCVRRFRLSLIGGGQARVTERFKWSEPYPGVPTGTWCREPELEVKTQTDGILHIHHGVLNHGPCNEMTAYAALFRPRTPQSVADRVAATLRLIDQDKENFQALLAHGQRCCVCQRVLRDETSKLLGIGPECAAQMGLPHNMGVANRVLARRRELLGDEGEPKRDMDR